MVRGFFLLDHRRCLPHLDHRRCCECQSKVRSRWWWPPSLKSLRDFLCLNMVSWQARLIVRFFSQCYSEHSSFDAVCMTYRWQYFSWSLKKKCPSKSILTRLSEAKIHRVGSSVFTRRALLTICSVGNCAVNISIGYEA